MRAEYEAIHRHSSQVETEHLLLALVEGTEGLGAKILEQSGVTANKVQVLLKPEAEGISLDDLFFQTEVENLSEEFRVDPALIRRIESQLLFKLREQSRKLELKLSSQLKRVLELASEEARQIQETIKRPCGIGTEHLLLGLLRDEEGRASQLLHELGLSLEETRLFAIEFLRAQGEETAEI